MASDEQLSLSKFIKNVHQQLRNKTRQIGTQEAWDSHCKNKEQLELYAQVMKKLAIKYWDNNICENSKEKSRVCWIHDICVDYFKNDKLKHYRNKENEVAKIMNMVLENKKLLRNYEERLIKMLDVGSCYNPLGIYTDCFDVLPIDIAPATSDVLKCDFLKVNIGTFNDKNPCEVLQLEGSSFDVVVFSLLLEYLPAPELRLLCCQKAYKLLKYEGLLLIVTPDSKHVGANAKLMKSWQYILAKSGFMRIQYTKLQHIHCMAFRKCISSKTSERWAELHTNYAFYDHIHIPQDFKVDLPTTSETKKTLYDTEDLPTFIDISEL